MKVRSPLGDYDYRVERISVRDGQLEVAGRLGEWQTTMVVERADLLGLLARFGRVAAAACAIWLVTRRLKRV